MIEKKTEVTVISKTRGRIFPGILIGILLGSLVSNGVSLTIAKSAEIDTKYPGTISKNLLMMRAKVIAFYSNGDPVLLNFGTVESVKCPIQADFNYAIMAVNFPCDKDSKISFSLKAMKPSNPYDFSNVDSGKK